MRGILSGLAGMALLAMHVQAAPAADPQKSRAELAERLNQAQARFGAKDYQAVRRELDAAIAHPAFATLPEEQRAQIHAMSALCAQFLADPEAGYRHALAGTKLKGAPPFLWQTRFGREMTVRNFADAVATVEAVAVQSPDTLNDWPMMWLIDLHRQTKTLTDTMIQRRLLVVLTGPNYQPREATADIDSFKRDLALMQLAEGHTEAAKALMAGIQSPYILICASVDPRLNPLLPADLDIRAAAERRLAHIREVAASHSGSMAAVVEIARYLRMLGRPEESLATVEAARPEGPQAAGFTDLEDQRNWWWNSLGESHVLLGHYDEAIAAYRKGAETTEHGTANVSQALNLAAVQLHFGHAKEALTTLAPFDRPEPTPVRRKADARATIADAIKVLTSMRNMSPYGEMVYRCIHGGALLATGQAEAAKADIAFATAHEKDHPDALMDLLIRAGDMDAAAAALIRRLDDPDRRSDAILQLSDYDDPPVRLPPDPFDAGLKVLRQRSDVKAAIARAGGTRRFHLQAGMV